MKYKYPNRKIIKLLIILGLLLIYYFINKTKFNPVSVWFLFIAGGVYAFNIRSTSIDIVDLIYLIILLYVVATIYFPRIDILGIFIRYIIPTSNLLSLILFMLGYNVSYIFTKTDKTID